MGCGEAGQLASPEAAVLRDEVTEDAGAATEDEAEDEAVPAATTCGGRMEVAPLPPAPAAVVRPMVRLLPGPKPTEEEGGCCAAGLRETTAAPEDADEGGTEEGPTPDTEGKEEEWRLESPSTPAC